MRSSRKLLFATEISTEKHNQSKCRVMDTSPAWQNNPTAEAQETRQKGKPNVVGESENWGKVVSSTKNIGKILLTWPPESEVNNNDTNDQVKVNWEKPTSSEPYTKNYNQPRKAENRRGGLPQRRTHQLVVCPMPNGQPWKHISKYHSKNEQVIFSRYMCLHAYVYIQ